MFLASISNRSAAVRNFWAPVLTRAAAAWSFLAPPESRTAADRMFLASISNRSAAVRNFWDPVLTRAAAARSFFGPPESRAAAARKFLASVSHRSAADVGFSALGKLHFPDEFGYPSNPHPGSAAFWARRGGGRGLRAECRACARRTRSRRGPGPARLLRSGRRRCRGTNGRRFR
jgi:hypothetical protein